MERIPNSVFINFANNEISWIEEKPKDGFAGNVEQLVRLRMEVKECDVNEMRDHLKRVLDDIIDQKGLQDSEDLRYFTELRKKQKLEYKVENGRLVEKWDYDGGGKVYPYQLNAVFISLINYLTNPKSNLRQLKKCPFCDRFFIATDSKATFGHKDNGECAREYFRYHKRWQRENDPEKYGSSKPSDRYEESIYDLLKETWGATKKRKGRSVEKD